MGHLQSFKIDNINQGYYCENCNLYNDILTIYCKDCKLHRPVLLDQAAIVTQYKRNPFPMRLEREDLMGDKSKIELHAEFFNSGMILYSSMEFSQRREWRDKLSLIILEARANLSAADRVDSEESSKLDANGRQWLVTNDENAGSNALNQPKIRKERMSKADKLKEQMSSLGLDMGEINKIIGDVQKVATESSINNLKFTSDRVKSEPLSELCRIDQHENCIGKFKDNTGSHECSCKCHSAVLVSASNPTEPESNKPFDISKLKFGG